MWAEIIFGWSTFKIVYDTPTFYPPFKLKKSKWKPGGRLQANGSLWFSLRLGILCISYSQTLFEVDAFKGAHIVVNMGLRLHWNINM